MTWDKTKNVIPSLKSSVLKMPKNNVVYKIKCLRYESNVAQTSRHLQQCFKEHVWNKGTCLEQRNILETKAHLTNCRIIPLTMTFPFRESSEKWNIACGFKEFSLVLNTKDWYRSWTLTWKYFNPINEYWNYNHVSGTSAWWHCYSIISIFVIVTLTLRSTFFTVYFVNRWSKICIELTYEILIF